MGNVLTDRWMDIKHGAAVIKTPRTPREAATYLIKTYMPRYLPWEITLNSGAKKINTACNILFTDIIQLIGLDGPYHWVDKKGNPLLWLSQGTAIKGDELSANGLINWFKVYGLQYGYLQLSRQEAETLAAKDALVAVTYKNPNPAQSGHIGVMLENGTLAQAGKGIPFVGHPIEEGFGNHPIEFWGYVEANRRTE